MTETRPRIFTSADGRDRVAVPFWNGLLSALGAIAIGFAVAIAGAFALVIAVMVIAGHPPSANPGHPLAAAIGTIFYLAAGAFAWWRLRTTGRNPVRRPARSEVRVILFGIGAMILIHVAMAIQLTVTHQTTHVQKGFEHFTVVTNSPMMTAIGVGLGVLTIVVLGPIVEEIVFRGLIFGALARRLGVLGGALVTALLFGIAHGDLVLFPSLAAVGLVAALAYAATGNLTIAIILHALNNAVGAIFLIGTSLRHH